jgi:hypothetical protein
MRACFLGQNITALGNGVAKLQTPPLAVHQGAPGDKPKPGKHFKKKAGAPRGKKKPGR